MKVTRLNWWLVAGCAASLVLLAAPMAIILSHPTTGHVVGQVTDANGPVPHARVIVSFRDWHLSPIVDTSPHDIGVEADENGYFEVTREFDFRIGQISVGACSPSNLHGWTNVHEPRDADELVIVEVNRQNEDERGKNTYKHYRLHARTEFIGKGWPPPPNDSYFRN